ncbi:hypothetical protein [Nostoc sphaeroides]|uniref:Uncharacterized protein n=1 Tax=Nostoc sphaeroides CCNUC1 TaxID=2653204 RepID=A0A5P8VQV9_9NOSO|nr:hypothetical protein [Nostoc sphaeroides]QFS42661.1 hypothetical protein GXM_00134 [Nostoc sphaeroides CCNUC1]
MKIIDHKSAINRRQDERLIIVETAIHRVSCLNRTVLRVGSREWGVGSGGTQISEQLSQTIFLTDN